MPDPKNSIDHEADPSTEWAKDYKSPNDVSDYLFVKDSYEGSGHYRTGRYITPHAREMNYPKRRDLGFYKNYVRPVADARVNPVFDDPISRTVQTDKGAAIEENLFTEFLKNVDNAGTPINQFMEVVTHEANLQGQAFIVMDDFQKTEISATEAENIKNRTFPYIYMKTKHDVRGHKLNKFGNIENITFYDIPVEIEDTRGRKKLEPRFRFWNNQFSQLMKEETIGRKKMLISAGPEVPHNLGIVPVYVMYSTPRKDQMELFVESPFYELAKMNWTLYNVDSEIRELTRNQGFSILYIQTEKGGATTVGPSNYIRVPMEAKIPPGFASPESAIVENLMKYADDLVKHIFEIAEQNGVTAVKEAKSGIAKEWDFQAHGHILKKTSSMARQAEMWIAETFKLYTKTDFVYSADYKEEFQPRATKENIEMYQLVKDDNISPESNRMASTMIVREAFSEIEPEAMKKILDEINVMTADELFSKAEAGPPIPGNEGNDE